MEIIQPVWEITKSLWVPLKVRINYIRKFQENFGKLNKKVQDLYAKREDINREIESDKFSKMATSECKNWLKKVDEIENKVNEIEVKFKENKKCIGEWCPNIWWRMKLGKCIITMIEDIVELKESKFEVVVVAPPRKIEPTPTTAIDAITSTGHTIRVVLECLRDEKIGKIGVWGMGGVGKTTILKNLNNLPEIQLFQIVIWVTISKEWSVKKVQKVIAERLSLRLENNESDGRVARKLCQKLGMMKYLLLLDDLWDRIDLDDVGVPHPTRENGSKIVLTSRFMDVCQKMETNRVIKVEVLPEIEAWDLFQNIVGDVVDFSNIEGLAREVVKECGGLPLVLVVIGRSLRNVNDVHVWSNAVTELRRATFQIDADMEKLVFMQLKFSYDQLKDDNVKNCFLYCALYPEDFEIPVPELIEHWWVEGFIDGKRNFGEAYDKGHAIMNDLTNACLLERIEDYRLRLVRVKMHDMIRDLALRITSSRGEGLCRFVVKEGDNITAIPNEEDWEQAERMSLMRSNLRFLPKRPNCTFLRTLLLQNAYDSKEIPTSFFEHMHSLRVLNLSNTSIAVLPSSLLNLASLRGLFLGLCYNFYRLPSGIGHLTRLEVLHLGPRMKYLPIEVGKLIHLRSLRVEFYNESSVRSPTIIIPNGLLSKLTLLEDLRIVMDKETLKLWFPIFEAKAMMEELVNLKQLISLHIHFPKVEYLEYFLQRSCPWNERRFNSFWFLVGIFDWHAFSHEQYLGLYEESDDAMSNVTVIREVLKRSSAFELQNHKTCKKLSDFCSMEMMNGLEYCLVNKCDVIETLIDGKGLPKLEKLSIWNLPELRNIWEVPMPPQGVKFLRDLTIENCPKLSNIFLQGMIHSLSDLEELWVINCPEIAEIVREEDMEMVVENDKDVAVVLFPRLKILYLSELPKLVRICKRVRNPIAWPSLKELDIENCPNLKTFPLSSSRAPALIGVYDEAVELEYEDDATKQHVNRLHPRAG